MSNTPSVNRYNDIFDYEKEYSTNEDMVISLIDYVSFTFSWYQPLINFGEKIEGYSTLRLVKDLQYLKELIKLLGFTDEDITKDEHYGKWKGGRWLIGEHIEILFGGPKNNQGYYVNKLEIKGRGCRDFEARNGNYKDLFSFFKDLKHYGKPTRCDGTFDLYTDEYFDIDKLRVYLSNGDFVSKAKGGFEDWNKENRKTKLGETLYIGSLTSAISLCIYNKKLEKEAHGEQDNHQVHIRLEMRFKNERAVWFVNKFLEYCDSNNDFTKLLSDVLYDYLDFKDPFDIQVNLSERNTVSWWKEFLGVTYKAKLNYTKEKRGATLKSNIDYLERSIFRILAKVYVSYLIKDDVKGFESWLHDNLINGINKFRKEDFFVIRDYFEKEFGEKISNDDIVFALSKYDIDYDIKYNKWEK